MGEGGGRQRKECIAFASLRGGGCYLSWKGSCWYAQSENQSMLAKGRLAACNI
jgi:hypothetical protein